MKITVHVIYGVFSQKEIEIECSLKDTLSKLLDTVKEKVKEMDLNMDLQFNIKQFFLYNDQKLDFEKTIGSYEIKNGDKVYLMVMVPDAG